MNLKRRILELSKKHSLSHVGSNLSAVDILDEIFPLANYNVVVSSGHAGLAYFVVREKYLGENAEDLLFNYGIHAPMYGSLGHGLPIALGKAIAHPERDIYCLISDGECMEGSVWETLRIARNLGAYNLKVYVNANGYGGMEKIDSSSLEIQLKTFFPVNFIYTTNEPLSGLEAHYEKVI